MNATSWRIAMRSTGFLVAASVSLAAASPVAAADPANGLRITQRWCAECHLVTQDQSHAKADVMPFASVATRKTAQEIAAFLTDPHPKMPNMGLTRNEIADIVAYIKSLGSAPGDIPAAPEKKPADLPKSG
jgi:mono/diheme cytochrome c family protein